MRAGTLGRIQTAERIDYWKANKLPKNVHMVEKKKTDGRKAKFLVQNRAVVTIVIVPLLLPALFGKRGIFTRSPLLWCSEL